MNQPGLTHLSEEEEGFSFSFNQIAVCLEPPPQILRKNQSLKLKVGKASHLQGGGDSRIFNSEEVMGKKWSFSACPVVNLILTLVRCGTIPQGESMRGPLLLNVSGYEELSH